MNRLEILYNKLMANISGLEELSKEKRIELINYVFYLMCFNAKLLNSPEMFERLDVLVTSNEVITTVLNEIKLAGEEAYNRKKLLDLIECYTDIMKIDELIHDYSNYFKLMQEYQQCIDEYATNLFVSKVLCYSYEDYLKAINWHFNLVLEEKYNVSVSLVEEHKLVKKDNCFLRKYLKNKER